MRASTDQVRDLTIDVVDGARKRASGAVTHGAERVASTFDGAASTIGDGVERLVERVPSVGVAVKPPRRTHRLRNLLVLTVLLVVGAAVARKVLGSAEETASEPAKPGTGDRTRDNGQEAGSGDTDDAEPLEDANVADG